MSFSPYARRFDNYFDSESKFRHLYPHFIQQLDRAHWSPLVIAYHAAKFLAEEAGVKILDVGSGVGKFCLAGARHNPSAFFYGVEQRKKLIEHAQAAQDILGLKNVHFIHQNFTQTDFNNYDHFYFYNSFYENLAGTDKIDEDFEYSASLYNYYNIYLFQKLENMPSGTKLVTFQSLEAEVPYSYRLLNKQFDDLLKFWVKI
ncbi:MAG TPA: class I SAM-dependent methyltransferase [Puia sp.]|nr:class I SAM-dependent methyltransferase [Puia sp.]